MPFYRVLIFLGIGLGVVFVAGVQLSLDRDYTYSTRAAQLPAFSANHSDGVVRVSARGMDFRTRVAGLSNEGPGLILLHGFPETSWMWRPLLEAAAKSGFRVVAFDQRGYSPGARPEEVGAYAIQELTDDVLAVADAVGFESFHLVGHDWGSIVGWNLAGLRPDRVLSWASLSIAHPAAIQGASDREGPPAYVKVFQIPGLMENVFSWGNRFLMRKVLYDPIPEADLEEYLALFAEPGGLEAGFNWYRAQEPAGLFEGPNEVNTPTLWLYGNRDMETFTGPRVRELMPQFVVGPYRVIEFDAGHWLIQEQTEGVVDALIEHLESNRQPLTRGIRRGAQPDA